MLAGNELEAKKKDDLGKQILGFAQSFRSLLVPSPDVLTETALILRPLITLSDKVLPLKSYFNMVQQVQRTGHLAWALAQTLTKDLPTSTPAEAKAKAERATELELELRTKGSAYITAALVEDAKKSSGVSSEQEKAVENEVLQKINQTAQSRLCTEDVFMVACSFLKAEIAKQGSIYYLKGESPDFKETKKNRNPLNLNDEVVLKVLASGLARPDEERGAVERGQIDSGFNHIVRLNKLYMTMSEAVRWIKEGDQQNNPRCKIDVRNRFRLSHTDYERIMLIARREGLISFRNRKKDPANNYTLRAINHQRVTDYAQQFGYSPQKMLNRILEDFFAMLKKRGEKFNAGT